MATHITTLPLLALRDVAILPGTIAPIFIGRKKSLNALNASKNIGNGDKILLTAQKKQEIEDPKESDLYKVGVIAKIIQTVKLPNDNAKILVEATQRVKLSNIKGEDFFEASYTANSDAKIKDEAAVNSLVDSIIEAFKDYARTNKKINLEILNVLSKQNNPSYITNIIASHLTSVLEIKQKILEETDIHTRAEMLLDIIVAENTQVDADQQVQQRVKKQIEKTQREFYLNEQMKAIQHEIDGGEAKSEFTELEKKIKKLKLSKEAKEKVESELKKLKMMNPMSSGIISSLPLRP